MADEFDENARALERRITRVEVKDDSPDGTGSVH